MFTLTQTSTQTTRCNAIRRFLLQLHVNPGDVGNTVNMGNLHKQNTAERRAAESVNVTKDTIIMGENYGVIVPATTGMGDGSTGQAGKPWNVGPTGTEAQKVLSGNRVIGAGLVPQVETVATANAAKGLT